MFIIKKIILATMFFGVTSTWVLPSYADVTNDHGTDVIYNNLTNNFTYSSSNMPSGTPWAGMIGLETPVVYVYKPNFPRASGLGTNNQLDLLFNINYKNRYFVNSSQGQQAVGVNFINTSLWTVGTSLVSTHGNRRSAAHSGLQDADNAVLSSVFANYTIALYDFNIAAYTTIGRFGGAGYYQASALRAVPVTKDLVLNAVISLQYDDGRYAQSLYGVSASESSASGLSIYSPNGGFDNVTYGVTGMYTFNKHWMFTSSVTGTSDLGQVAKSPVVNHKQKFAVSIGAIYNIF
ncbi:MAG: MipA/OmpV family protein [Gammaproteobacteria bacterium]|nr:MipA/OmpV family protein [Gammaproteobacteria bacterium]